MRPSAAEVRWQDRAQCAGSAYDFTPDHESPQGLKHVRAQWCNPCPVRVECLAYALLYRAQGYWGGTMTRERTLLGYPRNRTKCPLCGCKTLVCAQTDGKDFQICQSCGVSWTRGVSHKGETDGRTTDGETAGESAGTGGGPGGPAPGAGGRPVPAGYPAGGVPGPP